MLRLVTIMRPAEEVRQECVRIYVAHVYSRGNTTIR